MKCFTAAFLLLAGGNQLLAQSNTVTSGGNATGSTGSASYSIGQIDYINANGTTGSFNLGVQQPFELFALNNVSEEMTISLTIGPNPSEGTFILNAEGYQENRVFYAVTDLNGKVVIPSKPLETSQIIDLQKESAGQYMLHLYTESEMIGTYKLIKNH
jgi:hypothetical protein